MLDFIEKNAADEAANQCMEQFYSKTLESFQATNNERLWLSTNTKLARLWLAQKDYERLTEKVRELHKACQREDGTDDPSKGTYSMEAYALEIQMYAETRNNKRLKVLQMLLLVCGLELILRQGLYQRALKVRSAVPHPKIMGIIRECGGKMHMSEGMQGTRIFPRRYTRLTFSNRELERSTERLLRVIPQLRRGWLSPAYSGAEVSRSDDHAHGLRHQSLRFARDQAVQKRPAHRSDDRAC